MQRLKAVQTTDSGWSWFPRREAMLSLRSRWGLLSAYSLINCVYNRVEKAMEECRPGRPQALGQGGGMAAPSPWRKRSSHDRKGRWRVSHRFHRKVRSPVSVPTPTSPPPLQKVRSRSPPSQSVSTTSCGYFQGRITESFDGRRSFSKFTECRNGVTVASSLTTSGTPRLGCRISNKQNGQFQENRETEDSSKSDTLERQGEESARRQSPPLITWPTNCLEVQESFGQIPRDLDGCTWPESMMSNHVDCALTSSVLPDSASHCWPLTTPDATPVPHVFAPNCLLQGVARHVLDLWTDMKDPLFSLTHRILINHSSPMTDRSQRDLLPFSFYPVSKVLEPVSVNKDSIRSNMMPASSDLNDWLLLVVTDLNWLRRTGRRAPSRPFDVGLNCGLARACSGTCENKHLRAY